MDFFKQELAKKRKALQDAGGGKKFVRRGELEQKKLEQLREEERKELEKKAVHKKAGEGNVPGSQKVSAVQPSTVQDSGAASGLPEDPIDKLVLPRAEVIRRMRVLRQPITLFGEDDDERLARLKVLMKTGDVDLEGEITEGQQNDFLRDMRNLKQGKVEVRKDKDKGKERTNKEGDGQEGAGKDQEEGNAGKDDKDDDEDDIDSKRLRANFDELCEEDRILVFFKKILKEWERELGERSEAEKRTQQGRAMLATYRQCGRYIDPLFKLCRRKQLYDDIREALTYMVNKCRERDYMAAMDKYIRLAIGNAPWPIGVTMVGIHERSAREKIHTNQVAHIMNDEITRKYLQSVKRLMTLRQRRYPALPSKSVEFNSLANGSDLATLKVEEAMKERQQENREQLRIAGGSQEAAA